MTDSPETTDETETEADQFEARPGAITTEQGDRAVYANDSPMHFAAAVDHLYAVLERDHGMAFIEDVSCTATLPAGSDIPRGEFVITVSQRVSGHALAETLFAGDDFQDIKDVQVTHSSGETYDDPGQTVISFTCLQTGIADHAAGGSPPNLYRPVSFSGDHHPALANHDTIVTARDTDPDA